MTPKRFVVLLLVILTSLLLVACGATLTPVPVDTPVPVEPGEPADTPIPPDGATGQPEDAWDRIQENGTMVVGISVDYPPFEYYNEEFQVVGFDPALMKEISDILGIEIEFKDIAFDGLGDALQVGQIDAAIAAISVTPKREEEFDFSHIYFVSEDAFIAVQGSGIGPITTVEDLHGYRVGVQKGSVYHDWLEENLVETGRMASSDLFIYSDIEQGFPDLDEGRVDLLVMDLPPAQLAVSANDYEIVAQGLHRERYAIAMTKGQNTLRTRINQALITLQNEGVVADLVQEHLHIEEKDILPPPTPTPIPPTPTPVPDQPTPTPTPIPRCLDSMGFVQDLSFDDHNMTAPPVMQPGQLFNKGWRVRNTGTCTWDSRYTLRFADGNQAGARMGGETMNVDGVVAPGGTYDFWVSLVAPLRPGVYQGIWQMHNDLNEAFGERIWVGIQVPAPATPTPVATQTPSPDLQFSVDRTNINQGECVTFSWNVTNVKEVYFYAEGQNWQNNGVAGQGSRQACPNQTTTYYLRVVKQDNSVETRQITVYVNPVSNAPNITRFTVDPGGSLPVGTCVNLQWEVQGDVSRVLLKRNNDILWDGAPTRGNFQDCPTGVGDKAYMLEASGPGGTNHATQNVNIYQPQAPPTPTPVPPPVPQPVIHNFTVQPSTISVNQCVTVAWSTGGGTEHVRIRRNGATVQDNAGHNGSLQDCLGSTGAYVYEIEASNREGTTIGQEAMATVQ
ncbi:MAG: transporter substrate-binding domain-containing protein [Chloroflexota bacterium]|nr:transporter substrate-binding domain-containing protein [Chloroflexota bacterium]